MQLKICSDQIQKLVEDKFQSSMTMDTTQKRLLDIKKSSEQAWGSLEESQSKVENSRTALLELQIEVEKERYRSILLIPTCFTLRAPPFNFFFVTVTHLFLHFIRFAKKRIEEELEVLRRKASRLRAQTEGSSIIEKLQQELGDYREILKCSICLDRTKQVCSIDQ